MYITTGCYCGNKIVEKQNSPHLLKFKKGGQKER